MFYFILVGSASVVVIIATIVVYIMSNLLRTTAGRCELMLLLGLFLIHFGYTWIHHVTGDTAVGVVIFIIYSGFLLTYFWTCVLTFDIWRSFRFANMHLWKIVQMVFNYLKVSRIDRRRVEKVSAVLLFCVWHHCDLNGFGSCKWTYPRGIAVLHEIRVEGNLYLFLDNGGCGHPFAAADKLHGLPAVEDNQIHRSRVVRGWEGTVSWLLFCN